MIRSYASDLLYHTFQLDIESLLKFNSQLCRKKNHKPLTLGPGGPTRPAAPGKPVAP